jgi:RNA polymerase sigma-70 factor (ECF subfamily)
VASLIPDRHDAEDVLQNTAVIALRKFSTFQSDRSFVSWAVGIARLEILNHRRKSARSPLLSYEGLELEMATVCEELGDEFDQRSRHLAECLNKLESRALFLVRLRYEDSLKPALIAERIGMGVVAVRVALSRARASLRACIESRLRQQPL